MKVINNFSFVGVEDKTGKFLSNNGLSSGSFNGKREKDKRDAVEEEEEEIET